MKKIIIPIALFAGISFYSCAPKKEIATVMPVQEKYDPDKDPYWFTNPQFKEYANSPEFQKKLREGLAVSLKESLKDVKIDFTKLFTYKNSEELVQNSERVFRMALDEFPDDLSRNGNAIHMAVTVNVADGLAAITGIYYVDMHKDMIVQRSIPNAEKQYEVSYNIPGSGQFPENGYTKIQDGLRPADAYLLSEYLKERIIEAKLTGDFMMISSGEVTSLYVKP